MDLNIFSYADKKMYIKIKVITEAKKEKIIKKSEDHFEISVKEPAERNLANKRVLELVKNYFKAQPNKKKVGQVYNGNVRIVSGHHSPSKIISLDI